MVTADWNEKAERLCAALARLDAALLDEAVHDESFDHDQRRGVIAQWLRQEFSNEPPEDTQTLALFPGGVR